jgi:hypothetical protein
MFMAHRDLASRIHIRNAPKTVKPEPTRMTIALPANVTAARYHPLAGGLRNIRAIASKLCMA